jgi:hypothetical protein
VVHIDDESSHKYDETHATNEDKGKSTIKVNPDFKYC